MIDTTPTLTNALEICNSCDAATMHPGERRGYCLECAITADYEPVVRAHRAIYLEK